MAGTNLSTLSIQVGMDSNAAERGFNRLGALIDGMSSKISTAAMAGSAIGTAMGAAAVEFGRRVEQMIQSVIKFRMEADKAKFQKMIDEGASVDSVVNSQAFDESVLGGMTKMKSAWDEMLDSVTSVFAPALSGVFTGIGAVIKGFTDWFKDIFDPKQFKFEDMFKNAYTIVLDIAKVLIDAATGFIKIVNKARELAQNISQAGDMMALDVGLITRETFNERLNNRLGNFQEIQQANAWLDRMRDKAWAGLDAVRDRPPQFNFDPNNLFNVPVQKQAQTIVERFDPKSVFAPMMERGGMDDWRQTQIQRGAMQDDAVKKLLKEAVDELKKQNNKPVPGSPAGIVAIGQGIVQGGAWFGQRFLGLGGN